MSRETRMAARREAGKTYKYKANPYPKDSEEYIKEANERASKNANHRLPAARWTSIMKKVDNELLKKSVEESKKKQENNKKKEKTEVPA